MRASCGGRASSVASPSRRLSRHRRSKPPRALPTDDDASLDLPRITAVRREGAATESSRDIFDDRVLLFVSRDSGPQQGAALASRLRAVAGPAAVWELPTDNRGGPGEAAPLLTASSARVAVLGGDGTASWVISSLLSCLQQPPPVAVLPLGTGNDLARETGWAACPDTVAALATGSPAQLQALLRRVEAAPVHTHDWWRARSVHAESQQETFFLNYCSIGFDAGVALAFDSARRRTPSLFTRRRIAKAAYGLLGALHFVLRKCCRLPTTLTLTVDGARVPLPRAARGVVLLNIGSFMGGVRPWPAALPAPSAEDGLLEVGYHRGAVHLMLMNAKLAHAVPLCYAREVRLSSSEAVPVQADGEGWTLLAGSSLSVSRAGGVRLLHAPD